MCLCVQVAPSEDAAEVHFKSREEARGQWSCAIHERMPTKLKGIKDHGQAQKRDHYLHQSDYMTKYEVVPIEGCLERSETGASLLVLSLDASCLLMLSLNLCDCSAFITRLMN